MIPPGVFSEMCPEPALFGTIIVKLEDDAELGTAAGVAFIISRSLAGVESKFAPAIATAVPGAAICGVNESMRGAPVELVTVNGLALVTDATGAVTVIAPVIAPDGTVTTSCVDEADVTVAAVPLNDTASCAGSGLKLAPEIVTCVPTGPDFGLNVNSAAWLEVARVIEITLPKAS